MHIYRHTRIHNIYRNIYYYIYIYIDIDICVCVYVCVAIALGGRVLEIFGPANLPQLLHPLETPWAPLPQRKSGSKHPSKL